jgi:2-polyprenyl-3-methyl-5-hydroxy-6-metoxy-1,4-benzoquinol methylase
MRYYAKLGCDVRGIDVSERMLMLAGRKQMRTNGAQYVMLGIGDATNIQVKDKSYDLSVCVRFLDLIEEEAMRTVMKELARVSRKWIILTIRLGDEYVPKSNTAEHDRKKFRALTSKLGFEVVRDEQFREGSWHVMLLQRK